MGRLAGLLAQTGDPLTTPKLLTPRDVRDLLARHGLAPRRADGQNFLTDPNTVRRIVDAADLDVNDTVLEVGPGLGSLTLGLAGRVRRIVAVELDAGLAAALAEVLGPRDDVAIVHADAATIDLDGLLGEPARLIANLPYNAATPIVMHALASSVVRDAFVMVQREVGERWAAQPGHPLRAAVSVKIDLVAQARTVMTIPRTVFHPVPNVDSVMVRLTRRADAPAGDERARIFRLVEQAFAQRRKTLRNTLRPLAEAHELADAARSADIDLAARAETLTTSQFRALAEALDAGRAGRA